MPKRRLSVPPGNTQPQKKRRLSMYMSRMPQFEFTGMRQTRDELDSPVDNETDYQLTYDSASEASDEPDLAVNENSVVNELQPQGNSP